MLSLYLKARNDAGAWRTKKVVEGRGIRTSTLTGPFFVRPVVRGKQTEKRLHALTFAAARTEADHLETALDAEAKGLTVAELDAAENAHRLPLRAVIDGYLALKANKSKKTRQQYALALGEFLEAMAEKRIRFLDAVTVDALRHYVHFMTRRGYAGKTIEVRLGVVYFMLKKSAVDVRVPKDELPAVETETAVPYAADELEKLFAAMNPEESIRYKFFLGTAARAAEVTFAAWSDLDLAKGTFTVRSKPKEGFIIKNHESRTVPLPDSLVTLLKAYRKMATPRWIFGGADGKPGNHFLRKLKAIALRAGLNCGDCRTKLAVGEGPAKRVEEVTCRTHPVCEHFYLHRFRKTAATRWAEAGVPVRTIQHWLGHKSLEVTALYIGVTDSGALRGKVNAAYGD